MLVIGWCTGNETRNRVGITVKFNAIISADACLVHTL